MPSCLLTVSTAPFRPSRTFRYHAARYHRFYVPDETLTSRDLINTKITASLDEATDRWGIKVNRVELKNIEPRQRSARPWKSR